MLAKRPPLSLFQVQTFGGSYAVGSVTGASVIRVAPGFLGRLAIYAICRAAAGAIHVRLRISTATKQKARKNQGRNAPCHAALTARGRCTRSNAAVAGMVEIGHS